MDINQLSFQHFGGVDLMAIEGVSHNTVLGIMSEIGLEGFKKFDTSKQFASWLHLSPNTKITGGKVINSHLPKGGNRLKTILISCGRTDIGRIRNNTSDTLKVLIKLNYPTSRSCPDNYFREELFQRKLSSATNKDSTVYWLIHLDTATNIAEIILLPNQSINLGTVRMGNHRNNYKS